MLTTEVLSGKHHKTPVLGSVESLLMVAAMDDEDDDKGFLGSAAHLEGDSLWNEYSSQTYNEPVLVSQWPREQIRQELLSRPPPEKK